MKVEITHKNRRALVGAKVNYFFRETFRAHSRAEYKEIFSRGFNRDNSGISGTFPWLYVRAFFALFMLFAVNAIVLRLTDSDLYLPSVIFLGGVAFSVPFLILIYELYPGRDMSLFMLIAVLVVGGTASSVLAQVGYAFIPIKDDWAAAVAAGCLEEIAKLIPAVIAISLTKQKNPYACYLLAAAVGTGFSVIEDMGYLFIYYDKYYLQYGSEVGTLVAVFFDRGASAFCTHIIWTGAVGWAYAHAEKPFKSLIFFGMTAFAVGLHIVWDLPLGNWRVLCIAACVAAGGAVNITVLYRSRLKTLTAAVDMSAVNEGIIRKARHIGERMRFTNAANLTMSLTFMALALLVLVFSALPIGVQYTTVEFGSKQEFIDYMQCGFNLYADRSRKYDPDSTDNFEERYIEGELYYVIQSGVVKGCDGVYYYGYYVSDDVGELDAISVELEYNGTTTRYFCYEYAFGESFEYVFEVVSDLPEDYTYNSDGSVTMVTDAEEFENYGVAIVICAAALAVTVASTVILAAFTIKLRRLKNA